MDSKPCTARAEGEVNSMHLFVNMARVKLVTMNEDGDFPASHVIVYQCYYSTSFILGLEASWVTSWEIPSRISGKVTYSFFFHSSTVWVKCDVRQCFDSLLLRTWIPLLLAWFLASHFFFGIPVLSETNQGGWGRSSVYSRSARWLTARCFEGSG